MKVAVRLRPHRFEKEWWVDAHPNHGVELGTSITGISELTSNEVLSPFGLSKLLEPKT